MYWPARSAATELRKSRALEARVHEAVVEGLGDVVGKDVAVVGIGTGASFSSKGDAAFGTNPKVGPMSQEYCAHLCCKAGFAAPSAYFGVEYGAQCFCGNGWAGDAPPAKLDVASCGRARTCLRRLSRCTNFSGA